MTHDRERSDLMNRDRFYIAVLVLLLAGAVLVELVTPAPLDWTLSFQNNDTRPYGCRILYELLDDLFPGVAIREMDLPAYVVLRESVEDSETYLFITDRFAPDDFETMDLWDFVEQGNTVFVAAYSFGGLFADTLKLQTRQVMTNLPRAVFTTVDDSVGVNFVNPALRNTDDFYFEEGLADDFFASFDTLRATVLGVNSEERANYIRVEVGAGVFYLSSIPVAFTNYYALRRGNAEYAYRALSYLPEQPVLWDEYYKPNRLDASTPLRFVLRHPALKGAYWTLILLVLVFMVFEARRRQRIIPVIAPLKNTTVEFVETVGQLYYQHAGHANLAEKKITYFLDYVRQHLGLPTHTVDSVFLDRVAERSGVPAADVRSVFEAIAEVREQVGLSEAGLHHLNTRIEAFYQQSKR